MSLAGDVHLAAHQRSQAEHGFEQLRLSVARHAGHAHDLARADLERGVANCHAPVGRSHRHAVDDEPGQGAAWPAFGRQRWHALADHPLDEFGVGERRGCVTAHDHPTAAQDRDAVGDRPGLTQLVGDDGDGQPVLAEAVDHVEERVDFLWGQRAGRLVEDDDA